jgi:hypothetical protein
MTLTELRASYDADRSIAVDNAVAGPNRCRYCGKHWIPFARSGIDGHVACVVSEAFRAQLLAVTRQRPGPIVRELAAVLGVSESVVRGWIRFARNAETRAEAVAERRTRSRRTA